MGTKGDFISFDDGSDLDPDVSAAIRKGRERQARRESAPAKAQAQSPGKPGRGTAALSSNAKEVKAEKDAERLASARDRKAEKDAQRNRRMIDLPEDLERDLVRVAGELSVPVSSLIVWLVDRAMQFTSMEDIRDAREPSRSMRFEYILRPRTEDGPNPPPQEEAAGMPAAGMPTAGMPHEKRRKRRN